MRIRPCIRGPVRGRRVRLLFSIVFGISFICVECSNNCCCVRFSINEHFHGNKSYFTPWNPWLSYWTLLHFSWGFLHTPPRPVGGRLAVSVEAVAASAADLGFGPAGAAIFLGHFWVTYSAMTQSNTTRNVPCSHTIHLETQYLETQKYDTFRKNALS